MLAGRRIVLGVTGGVAAYKAVYLARRILDAGAEVRVVMTDAAAAFVGEPSFAAVTGSHPVRDLFADADVSPHTSLARWADAIVLAPATAATIARVATGQSSDAVTATVLAARVPVVVAPAMHTEMWDHPATQRNIATLTSDGYHLVGPDAGDLAGGDVGIGRMSEPETIVEALIGVLGRGPDTRDLADLSVVVTAGGTREPIDPVRYIGNRSSGKMGTAIAEAAADRGARVTLVTSAPAPTRRDISVVAVATAEEMASAVWSRLEGVDVVVMAAAVADFRPATEAPGKLRRADGIPVIELEPTPDVLAGVVDRAPSATVVGFAAEAGSLDEASSKAERKGVDLLVANDIARSGSGFGSDTNEVRFVFPDGTHEDLDLAPKAVVADRIWDAVLSLRA